MVQERAAREVIAFNVELRCDYVCEDCEKFFDCRDERKERIYRRRRMSQAINRMAQIKHKIAISGGKGGVGKSLVTVNLATTLALMGRKVSILDQDFDGATVAKMFGLQGVRRLKYGSRGIIPAQDLWGLGIQIVSISLIYPDEVITMFQELRRGTTEEFLANVDYGERDYLLVDMPPGTSSAACNLLRYIPGIDGTIVVVIPQIICQPAAKRAIMLSVKAGCEVLGIIENMSGYVCGDCGQEFDYIGRGGGEALAQEFGVPLLGRLPLHPELSLASDEGIPFVYRFPDNPASKQMMEIARELEEIVGFQADQG